MLWQLFHNRIVEGPTTIRGKRQCRFPWTGFEGGSRRFPPITASNAVERMDSYS